ncbi:NAD(P)-binding protein [Tsuneonella mangrovi]|uniref:NAD(P)-binding protein n=1 Tax=Tsuneonella mangrovi TaxID=1982042 RepID=UPI000BA24C25|nr:NAD(P)-binding protein [Tsuneonella mangrovi]
MADLETDYLVVGAGAVGMAFVDTLLEEDPDCHITIVDKHARPGGHWNDAYSFVRLHQPSSTYGVNSLELCTDRVDLRGHNAGMYPLATQAEILAYYQRLMDDRFLASRRVAYFPLSEYHEDSGGPAVRELLSGKARSIEVRRKLVDATWYQTSVPATHKPAFEIAQDTRFAIPGDLPSLWKAPEKLPEHYVVLGGGKTAMDSVVWLLEAGVAASKIGWVRPRDSWMMNRRFLQPAKVNFEGLIDFQRLHVLAAANSDTGEEMFARLEEGGVMLRIDPQVTPEMFHYAVISEGEVEMLRTVKAVYRQGRVTRVEPGRLHFGDHIESVPRDTLFIDCTATAVPFERRADDRPIFDGNRITLRLARVPFVPYCAALAAFLEANFQTDEERNALVPIAPLTDTSDTYPFGFMCNMISAGILGQNEKTNAFNNRSRLDPIGPALAELIAEGSPKLAKLEQFGRELEENMPKIMALGMKAKAIHEAA